MVALGAYSRLLAFMVVGYLAVEGPSRSLFAQQDAGGGEDAFVKKGKDLWILDFQFQKLRMITPRRGPAKGATYWYMVYTLENKTGQDREFFLSITAESDRGKTYSTLLLPHVEREVERKEGRPLWGKTDKFEILAKRDPSDNKYNYTTIKADEHGKKKRHCVAVFNALDANANKITMRLVGLSNDLEARDQDDGTTLIKERTKVLEFERAGDEYAITQDSFKLLSEQWLKTTVLLEPAEES